MMECVDGAETYLRVLAEEELRGPAATLESVARLHRAGEILLVAGALTRDQVTTVVAGFELARLARSRTDAAGLARVVRRLSNPAHTEDDRPEDTTAPRVVPVGVVIAGDDDAAFALHLMTLACLPGRAVITAALRVHRPPEVAAGLGPGPHQLPFGSLGAVDESGRPYRLRLHGDASADRDTWHGVVEVLPPPAPEVRWLDVVADGTNRLARLDLTGQQTPAGTTTVSASTASPGERLLAIAAEHILAGTWDSRGPFGDGLLGELTDVLAGAGLIAADSGTPGKLAALCERSGRPRHGIHAAPAGSLPERWASALTRPAAPGSTAEFIPLAVALPPIDGARFAVTGLASADGESVLHVAATGHVRTRPHWGTGFSWWIRDGAGGWHVAGIPEELDQWGYRDVIGRMPLAPPLPVPAGPAGPTVPAVPGELELVVTGPATHVHAVLIAAGRQ